MTPLQRAVLVVNAGSSSLKFSLFDVDAHREAPRLRVRGEIEALASAPRFRANVAGRAPAEHAWPSGATLAHAGAVAFVMEFLQSELAQVSLVAAGHRVVHGGTSFNAPVRIDADVLDGIVALVPLAPLHQPHNVAGIRAVASLVPDLPQVACFDTAFHRGMPRVEETYALPAEIVGSGVRRYGFHGISYEYVAGVLPAIDRTAAEGRTIVAHLGNGASLCALRGGRSIATTMGFTALDGLVMGTRCGALDPGVVLHLLRDRGMTAAAVETLLYQRSGLLGLSGISGDMRTLLASDDPRARFAVDLFVYRLGREIGSLAAALGGVDALVFTAGIGEHAAAIRARVLRDAAWLGFTCDDTANEAGGPLLSRVGERPCAWVIPTNEELMIARHSLAALT